MKMKLRIYLMTMLSLALLCTGCNTQKAGADAVKEEKEPLAGIEANESGANEELKEESKEELNEELNEANEESVQESDDETKIDFFHDYSEEIGAEVEDAVSVSASLQEELANIEKLEQKYNTMADSAMTQEEMNASSQWLFAIWDAELNSLWNRFSDAANQQTKEEVLEEQRQWIEMKEEATLLSIGSSDENGSIYPLLQNSFLEDITKNRAYVLANKLAEIKEENFTMPEASYYGLYVDNQGTGSVYSSLITRQNLAGEDEAVISIFRLGETRGSFADRGNGEFDYTAEDGVVQGIIRINGWYGASFEVTAISEDSPFSPGDIFEFPFVF